MLTADATLGHHSNAQVASFETAQDEFNDLMPLSYIAITAYLA